MSGAPPLLCALSHLQSRVGQRGLEGGRSPGGGGSVCSLSPGGSRGSALAHVTHLGKGTRVGSEPPAPNAGSAPCVCEEVVMSLF